MSTNKGPIEGGSGGKRGHSNMEHWDATEEIKLLKNKCTSINLTTDKMLSFIKSLSFRPVGEILPLLSV